MVEHTLQVAIPSSLLGAMVAVMVAAMVAVAMVAVAALQEDAPQEDIAPTQD